MHRYIHILKTKKWSRLLVHVLSWTKVISFYSVSKFSVIILFIQLLILILKEKFWKVEILTSTLETLHKSGLGFTNCHIRPIVIKFFFFNLLLTSVKSRSCFAVEPFVLLVHGNKHIFTFMDTSIHCIQLWEYKFISMKSRKADPKQTINDSTASSSIKAVWVFKNWIYSSLYFS